jgi:hypothetical protein
LVKRAAKRLREQLDDERYRATQVA